jgi:hypothetical protein
LRGDSDSGTPVEDQPLKRFSTKRGSRAHRERYVG